MQIWVDADACPKVIKEILFRAAKRLSIPLTLVSNQRLRIPNSQYIKAVQVPGGFDVADAYIIQHIKPNDLVITADIPLAAEVVEKGGYALNPRGELYTSDNIRYHLSVRNFMDELRGSGVNSGGPATLNQNDRQTFANQLDQFLTKHLPEV
ncbi:MAG: YaiI/YqxD family protein [Calditrichaeota bacterium]|nr:YaiI/YqxD family protein [Calditrichota bacterium]